MENKIHVPNHQPVWDLVTCWFPFGNLMFRIGDHKKRHWKDIGGPHSWKAPMAGCFIWLPCNFKTCWVVWDIQEIPHLTNDLNKLSWKLPNQGKNPRYWPIHHNSNGVTSWHGRLVNPQTKRGAVAIPFFPRLSAPILVPSSIDFHVGHRAWGHVPNIS
jgi:hypothetical protein